jgi:hypothetical protein
MIRSGDLSVAASFNSRDRTVNDWKLLFDQVSSGFTLGKVIEPQGSALGILEFTFEG